MNRRVFFSIVAAAFSAFFARVFRPFRRKRDLSEEQRIIVQAFLSQVYIQDQMDVQNEPIFATVSFTHSTPVEYRPFAYDAKFADAKLSDLYREEIDAEFEDDGYDS